MHLLHNGDISIKVPSIFLTKIMIIKIFIIKVCGKMPYDDSDIRKMIKAQFECKHKQSKTYKELDTLVQKLLEIMLEPDVTKRANIEKVLKHPYLAKDRLNPI